MNRLTQLQLTGFKSIKNLQYLQLGQVNVLIGSNGAGKSNLISFFRLLSWMLSGTGNLQMHIAKYGGGSSVLFEGSLVTTGIKADLTLESRAGINEYAFELVHAAKDVLVFTDECYRFSRQDLEGRADWSHLGSGHKEAALLELEDPTARVILSMLRGCVVYQFHNTSENARIRQYWNVDDNKFLKEDGANLAPFLLHLQEHKPAYYRRIVETIKDIVPFFDDFVLEPDHHKLLLQWKEKGSDIVFGPHQASDGTLRIMALASLLLQPEGKLPPLIIIDEPELGLHPYAITVIAGLLKSVSFQAQVLLATQSTAFVDQFEPEDILVVERRDRESLFKRLDAEALQEWLEEYSISELWEKNVLGGRP